MKVLIVHHTTEIHGTFKRVFCPARYLVKGNINLTILSPSVKRLVKQVEDGVHLVYFPAERHKITADMAQYAWRLLNDCDLAHITSPGLSCTAVVTFLAKLRGVPTIVDWDDWRGPPYMDPSWIRKMKRRLIVHPLEKFMPKQADAVTVCSQTLRTITLGLGIPSERIFYVPNGCDAEKLKPIPRDTARTRLGLDLNKQYVVYCGFFNIALQQLIQAWKTVSVKQPNARLLIVGDYTFLDRKLAEDLNLRDSISFIGFRPHSEVPYWLGSTDVAAMPMLDSIVEWVRFPIRFGEYLAMGLPTVVSDIGEPGRIAKEEKCALLADPHDPQDFGEKILMFLENESLADECRRRARATAEGKYSWRRISEIVKEAYLGVAQS